jgi:HSP20 family protein
MEPQDIAVEVSDGPLVTIHAELRGALKGDKDIVLDEWTAGPYHREIPLPANVDGQRANVTYSNGVLVIALPLAATTTSAELSLGHVSATHGERVGNRGRNMQGDTGPPGLDEDTTSYDSGDIL